MFSPWRLHALAPASVALVLLMCADGQAAVANDVQAQAAQLVMEATQAEQRGEFTVAASALRSALELNEHTEGVESDTIADVLRQLGWVEYRVGHYTSAETHLRRSVGIYAEQAERRDSRLAKALNSLGVVERDVGAYEQAEQTFDRALEAMLAASDPDDDLRAVIHNNRAGLSYYRSDYRRAVGDYREALRLFTQLYGEEHGDVAQVFNNLGMMHLELGDYAGARSFFERALQVKEKVFGAEHATTASTVNNLAMVSGSLRDDAAAELFYGRALSIYENALGAEHPNVGQVLQAWGEFRHELGDQVAAETLLTRALAVRQKNFGSASSWVGETLNALGLVQTALGSTQPALDTLRRAIEIAVMSGEQEILWSAYANYAGALASAGEASAAAFFAKYAVNVLQEMRSGIAELEQPLQQSFLARREPVYRALTDQLITIGRLAEAEQVVTMLREEEYFDYVRSVLQAYDAGTTRAKFAAHEKPLSESYDSVAVALARAAESTRRNRDGQLPAQDQPELERLRLDHARLIERISEVLAGSDARFGSPADEDSPEPPLPAEGIASLHYFATPERLRILAATNSGAEALDVAIPAAQLNRLVFELRRAVQDPKSDPQPAAQALYEILIAPVRSKLKALGIRSLVLALDGSLRFLPFGALHDGERYLVEDFSLSVRTLGGTEPAGTLRGADRLAGFGVTRSMDGYPPLPRVATELERIVKRSPEDSRGVIEGVVLLDEQFTANGLIDTLAAGYPLVHIASHFVFQPGPLDQSFLLLGDGTRLTLDQVRPGQLSLHGVELLTLSACSTAIGEDGGSGRELESFSTLSQRLGAREVVATQWPVADLGTAVFMRRFYTERQRTPGSTADSLARTQRSMFADTRRSPYAHPFYWAPFVLFKSED